LQAGEPWSEKQASSWIEFAQAHLTWRTHGAGDDAIGLAKWLEKRGGDCRPATILRHVQRMADGEAYVSGEMRVILPITRAGKAEAEKKVAA
jgi:hypothetical protein